MKNLAKIVSVGMTRDIRYEDEKLVTGPGGIQGFLTLKVGKKECKVWIPHETVMEIGKAIASIK